MIKMLLMAAAMVASVPNLSYEHAVATERYYIQNGDYTNMVFQTDDGNDWVVEDYICPLEQDVIILFDTKGNTDLYDDEIVNIITYWSSNYER